MIIITWGDWFDDLAGLREYKYQIYKVSSLGNVLKENGQQEGGEGTIHLNDTFVSSVLVLFIIYHKYIRPLSYLRFEDVAQNMCHKNQLQSNLSKSTCLRMNIHSILFF